MRGWKIALVGLGLAGCQMESGLRPFEPPPPATEVEPVAEELHGTTLIDRFRWLEDGTSPQTRAWIEAENQYTDALLKPLPGREELHALVSRLLKIDSIGVPTEAGGRYFFRKRLADQDLDVVYYREGLRGDDRVLLDPHPLSADHTTSLSLLDISQDGELVAYAVREGGVDEITVRLREVQTGKDLPDVLPRGRYAGVSLTPDRTGLYYSRYGNDAPRIYYHRLGTETSTDTVIFGEGLTSEHIPYATVSEDGRHLLIHVLTGSAGPTAVWLWSPGTDARTMIDDGESRSFASFAGDRAVILTDWKAPRKRVMVCDLENPGREDWTELVAERGDVVLEGATGLAGRVFVSYLRDVHPGVAVYDLAGEEVDDIDVHTVGSLAVGSGRFSSPEVFLSFSSFHVASRVYRYDADEKTVGEWARVDIPVDTDAMDVTQVFLRSRDGSRIPMFLLHRNALVKTGDHPTLLTGYGGFNVSLTPQFSALGAAWVENGGVYAVANLRGGGEYGEAWHRAGMLESKQNVFDDFAAAAQYLIDEGYTRSERLAVMGGSNGGLLVGALMTQHPRLVGAVVCSYPLLDMIRYHRFLVAQFWVPEYGSSENPEQFRYLINYSPYHRIRSGQSYPATFLITGDGDTRVDPLHARKMTARLQECNRSPNPILLRYYTKAGHSGGQPLTERIEQMVDVLSFLRWRVGEATVPSG